MTAQLLTGKTLAFQIRQQLAATVNTYIQKGYRRPGLAVILVGEDAASTIYVNNKRKACEEAGFHSASYDLPVTTTEKELLALIDLCNKSSEIDGILVQLPLPDHINTQTIIEHILPEKDVDGFHPYNLGRLAQGNPLLRPCTPYGIMQLIDYYGIPIKGKQAIVIGTSNIVGKPMGLELLNAKATVTLCHRQTRHLKEQVNQAEILVIATGVMDVVDVAWLNKEQIVIDVGIHRLANNTLRGDVNFLEAKEKVAWITPVPGGVGPMTISTLLKNTLSAFEKAQGIDP